MSCGTNCGCGPSSGCSCEPAGPSTASKPGFERPRFFGGMLLNETDLQTAVDYVVGKRKLTNRFVFGTGVICGLDVAADPCDPCQVIVQPGYALDCCGNDIFADCPETIDVLQLVAELKQEKGLDCGDPCDPDEDGERCYYLYVTYAETPSDPVAPYSSDNCGVGDCEFSRVVEGYRFELRCDPLENPDWMVGLIVECFLDEAEFREEAEKLQSLRSLTKAMTTPNDIVIEAGDKAPTAATFAAAKLEEPQAVIKLMTTSLAHASNFDRAVAGAEKLTDLTKARRTSNAAKVMELLEQAREAEETTIPPSALARMEVLAEAHNSDLAKVSLIDQHLAGLGHTQHTASQMIATQTLEMKHRLLNAYEARGLTATGAYASVQSVQPYAASAGSLVEVENLINALLALVQKCICTNINPKCPTCTDLGVALAKITVENCEVTDVCDLERRWILTPRTMEYLVPFNEIANAVLPTLCCEELSIDITDDNNQEEDSYDVALARMVDEGQLAVVSKAGDNAMPLLKVAASNYVKPLGFAQPPAVKPIESAAGGQVEMLERQLQAVQRSLTMLSDEIRAVKETASLATKGDGS